MTLSSTGGQFRANPTDPTQAGDYEIAITATLANWDIFTSPTSTIDPALKINPANPPPSFIYKKSFTIFLSVSNSPNSYVAPNNTSPFFAPTPTDLWFYASENFVKGFGPAYDNDGNSVTVTPDFGRASRFVFWDANSNTMSVPINATMSDDVGDYAITISLSDGVKTGYT